MWKGFFARDFAGEDRNQGRVGLRPGRDMASPTDRGAALIEEGRNHLLLGSAIEPWDARFRILQGAQDPGTCHGRHGVRAGRIGCLPTTWC